MSTARSVIGLAVCLGACLATAAVGRHFTTEASLAWYRGLAHPAWTPPDWVFGPVWTFLYLAMAVAAWIVYRRFGWAGARVALLLFGAQLVLNAAWTALFFGLRVPVIAFEEIIFLWVAILATMIAFGRKSAVAGVLMALYLGWVTFAAALNFAVMRMNR